MDLTQFKDIGVVGVLGLFFIQQVFALLGKWKNGKNGNGEYNKAILEELKTMNENHLHSLEKSINDGNIKIVESITAMHIDLIKELSKK